MPKAGRIYFVIHFKLYISSFTIKSSEDDIYVNERKSEIIIWLRFAVVQLLHIYIDHDHFCTCIKNSNHSRPLLILGILAYDRRKLYCFHAFVMSCMHNISRNIATFLLSLYFSRHVFISNMICLESEYLYNSTCIVNAH